MLAQALAAIPALIVLALIIAVVVGLPILAIADYFIERNKPCANSGTQSKRSP